MRISLQNLIPDPLAESIAQDNPSEIWNREVQFTDQKKYQLYAPSGRGKSTFVHIVYGLRQDYQGEVKLADKPITQIKRDEWANLRQKQVSVVFQDLRLFLHLTALENIQVKALLYEHSSEKIITDMAAHLGIAHLLHRKAEYLSYGERQRVAIIRALVQPFELLLLDEPFSHLDEENIKKACELITQKQEENQASLIMTSLGYPYYIEFDQRLIL